MSNLGDLPTTLDPKVQVHKMVVEAFDTIKRLQEVSKQKNPNENLLATNNGNILANQGKHEVILESMLTKASTPLFEGSFISMLLAMLLLLNLKIVHGLTKVFMDELLSLLRKKLLPKGNKMPTTTYEALQLIKELGLSYDSIHTCTNGCVFF